MSKGELSKQDKRSYWTVFETDSGMQQIIGLSIAIAENAHLRHIDAGFSMSS